MEECKKIRVKTSNRYEGHYDLTRLVSSGIASLKEVDGTVTLGYWKDDKCVAPIIKIDEDEEADINILKSGKHTVEFKSGVK